MDLRTTTTATWVEHGPDGTGPARFVARLGVRARLRGAVLGDLDDAGSLVEQALAAAGPVARLDSTRFAIDDPAHAAAQAREAAFADALSKAEQLARLAGRELGPVAAVVDVGGPSHAPVRMMAARAETLPLDAGEEVVSATLSVRWHWAP
ncbi:MAG: SIMPL domain-containing protein [Actinomycetales bacterium]|nr:SIMPL domain-containing protein [Actinomycetales bacterium]